MNKKEKALIDKTKYSNSEKVLQVYVKTSDLIRTEYSVPNNTVPGGSDYELFIPEIQKNGILDSLKVKADGSIMRGNTRCEVAIELNYEYVPIDLGFFIGLFSSEVEHITTIRKIIYDQEIDSMNNRCKPVKPPTTEEYRKKVGRAYGQKDYLINWTDEYVLLQSQFEKKEETNKDISEKFVVKKELFFLSRIVNHWKYCNADPTLEENCKWCHMLYNMELGLKQELGK